MWENIRHEIDRTMAAVASMLVLLPVAWLIFCMLFGGGQGRSGWRSSRTRYLKSPLLECRTRGLFTKLAFLWASGVALAAVISLHSCFSTARPNAHKKLVHQASDTAFQS